MSLLTSAPQRWSPMLLYTGEEKYKRWVLEYVDSWIRRIQENDGIIPDNVGPTGKVGEAREGQWWGGLHGWSVQEESGLALSKSRLGRVLGLRSLLERWRAFTRKGANQSAR